MLAILHNIRSLYNVGSIFRTAEAAGCEKLYLAGITPTPLDQFGNYRLPLIKVSLGAEKNIKWEKIKSTISLVDKLKKQGFRIFAVEQDKKSIPYYSLRAKDFNWQKTVLILGGEVKGLPPSVLNRADKILEIPLRGKKESLNVAVAFGIVVFNLESKI